MVNDLSNYEQNEQGWDENLNTQKQVIYWDADDVILDSGKVIVELINQKRQELGLPSKDLSDLKDWGFKSILRTISKKEVELLFESKEFWNRVQVKPEFIDLLKSGVLDSYSHQIVTKGSLKNQAYKFVKFCTDLKEWNWIHHTLLIDQDKSIINMEGGIQIDDNYDNLIKTNARVKILLRNGLTTDYNTNYGKYGNIDNLYIVETLEDVKQILQFNLIEKL